MEIIRETWMIYLVSFVAVPAIFYIILKGTGKIYGREEVDRKVKYLMDKLAESEKDCKEHTDMQIKLTKLETANQINLIESTLKNLTALITDMNCKIDKLFERTEKK